MTAFKVKVVIPARNEALSIAKVVSSVKDQVDQVIVVDNGSTDGTADIAAQAGAKVVTVSEPGYGRACLAGIEAAKPYGIIVFMDGDAADDPEDLQALLNPIRTGEVAFTRNSRKIFQTHRRFKNIRDFIGCRFGRMVYSHDDIRGSCKANAQRLVITKAII